MDRLAHKSYVVESDKGTVHLSPLVTYHDRIASRYIIIIFLRENYAYVRFACDFDRETPKCRDLYVILLHILGDFLEKTVRKWNFSAPEGPIYCMGIYGIRACA